MFIQPAYSIAASEEQLSLVGEICAIQGQIEFAMIITVQCLLKSPNWRLAQKILGSTDINNNAGIWYACIEEKSNDDELKKIAKEAVSQIATLSAGRNDFIHCIYVMNTTGGDNPKIVPHALRIKSNKLRPVSEVQDVRDLAAKLSCRMAHVVWSLSNLRKQDEPSPWLGKF